MKFAYADPPYVGCCRLYRHLHEPPWGCWDDPETHRALISQLERDYDGWALSLSTPALHVILPACPPDVRIAAWVKPFASFKPGVRVAYTWEPVIFRTSRQASDRHQPTIRDHLSHAIVLRRGLTGAKPPKFCRWVLDLLGYEDGDEMTDLFPGTGAMGRELAQGVLV